MVLRGAVSQRNRCPTVLCAIGPPPSHAWHIERSASTSTSRSSAGSSARNRSASTVVAQRRNRSGAQ
jgi:hypothetical protein